MQRFIVLDTETTGLSPDNGDRIIELGCVELVGRKPTGNNLHLYFNPERDSHEDALRVHGLTTQFLSDKPKFAEKARDILAYLQGAQLVIHNAPFDMGFLEKEFSLLGLPPLKTAVAGVTDSLALAKELFPGKRNSLDALCSRLEIDNTHRTLHGALLDAQLLAEVFINLTRGQKSLVMDEGETNNHHTHTTHQPASDYSQISLPILPPSAEELAAHTAMLQAIDKASGNATLWKKLQESTQSE